MKAQFLNTVHFFDALRTPFASAAGPLTEVLASRLLAGLLVQLQADGEASPGWFGSWDAFVVGGDGPARTLELALATAAAPRRVTALSVQRQGLCGLEAVRHAGLLIGAGDCTVAVAGGFQLAAQQRAPAAVDMLAAVAHPVLPAPLAADMLAAVHGLGAEDLDAWTERVEAATRRFAGTESASIRPIRDINGLAVLEHDAVLPKRSGACWHAAHWRTVQELHPAIGPTKVHHSEHHAAAPADGACLVLMGTAAAGQRHGWKSRGNIAGSASVSEGPAVACGAVASAVAAAAQRAHWKLHDVDCFEIHDAWAATPLGAAKSLRVPLARINRSGGSLRRGDPGAASGAWVLARLLGQLAPGQRGIAAISNTAGDAVGVAVERGH